jgi:hypothetical protein
MFLNSSLPKMIFALLGLLLIVSVSEAFECYPRTTNAGPACPSSCETAPVSPGTVGDPGGPPSPSDHAGADDSCALCTFCLSPCVGSLPVTVAMDDGFRRIAPPEFATHYEAPSFSLLRPPRG